MKKEAELDISFVKVSQALGVGSASKPAEEKRKVSV